MLSNRIAIISCTFIILSMSCDVGIEDEFADYVYQYSIIDALMAGAYDGDLTCATLKKYGDFGIGTFNALDGEMVVNDGIIYRVRYDGSVAEVPDDVQTPLAIMKDFQPDSVFVIKNSTWLDYSQLKKWLMNILEPNEVYAIRIKGNFQKMTTRAPAPAQRPYPPLVEYLKDHQNIFNFEESTGVVVGFYMPVYLENINVPGFHFHYLSEDKQKGGHVINLSVDSISVEIDKSQGFVVENLESRTLSTLDLSTDRQNEVRQVESGKIDSLTSDKVDTNKVE